MHGSCTETPQMGYYPFASKHSFMHTDQSNQDSVDSHLIHLTSPFIVLFHKLCYFTEYAISQKIAEILYGHYVCDAINYSIDNIYIVYIIYDYTIIAFMNSLLEICMF